MKKQVNPINRKDRANTQIIKPVVSREKKPFTIKEKQKKL
jgi:hypothetical protein